MEKGYLEIHGDTSEKELKEIKKTLISAIKSTKSTLPTRIDVISQIQRLANEAISVYETNENKEIIASILDIIGNYLIESNKGDKINDLSNLRAKGDIKSLLYSIHAITFFEGEKSIPENVSLKYLEDVINTRKANNKSISERLIYDPATIRFIERLGSEFRIKNPEAYAQIVKSIIYNPIRNNVSVRTDPRINGKNDMQDYSCRDMQSRKILEILINYGETLRTLEESDKSNQIEIDQLGGVTKATFREFIAFIKEKDPSYYGFVNKKFKNLGCFEVHMPAKDITEYKSLAEFLAEANITTVDTVDPKTHTPVQRDIYNHRTDPDGMSHDEKFRAIQELIKEQRKTTENLVVPTVMIGYKEPFKDYIVFGFSRESTSDFEELEGTELESDPIYNMSVSDYFGSPKKGGCSRVLVNDKINDVFGTNKSSNSTPVQGVSKRQDTYSIPGVISLIHNITNGFRYYVEMLDEAVDELRVNPSTCFNKALKVKISDAFNRPSKKAIVRAMKAQPKTMKVPDKTPKTVKVTPVPKEKKVIETDEYGYDKLGLNLEEIKRSIPYRPDNMKKQEEVRTKMVDTLKSQYGYGRNPGLALLDYCLEEMLVSGKSIVKIADELSRKEGYRDLPEAYDKMYSYIRNMIIVAVDNDPDYPNEKMKEIYERELDKLDAKGYDLDVEIEEKRKTRDGLVKNTRKALEYFNTTIEEEEK